MKTYQQALKPVVSKLQKESDKILKTLLSWAQENLDVPQIIGYAPIDHKASQRVMEKCGMTYFKTEKDPIYGTVCAFYQYVKSL
jgi:RimJ/RimL family protein N-acetyltransferase